MALKTTTLAQPVGLAPIMAHVSSRTYSLIMLFFLEIYFDHNIIMQLTMAPMFLLGRTFGVGGRLLPRMSYSAASHLFQDC